MLDIGLRLARLRRASALDETRTVVGLNELGLTVGAPF
jgi:hypothetical protein